MSNSNTSFEHILHNIQERSTIIGACNESMKILLSSIKENNDAHIYSVLNSVANSRIFNIYNKYSEAMSQFNIDSIPFINDYYSIIDAHIDQFHFRYLYNYSGVINHYNPIIKTQNDNKFNIKQLVSIFNDNCHKMKHFKLYNNTSSSRHIQARTRLIYKNLSRYISTVGIYDTSDLFMYEFKLLIDNIKNLSDVQKNVLVLTNADEELINLMIAKIQQFNNIRLDIKPSEESVDYCECGNVMQVMPDSSELICDNCGYLHELKGTVFNDCQFYSQESIRYKHAGYEPSKHVKSWLERIQAKETNTITNEQIMKIEACIKRDGITNKKKLTIEQLRRYLKDSGLTELNEHVALIKRIITGITPPQLTYAETQDITNSFSKAVKAYNVIRPSNKSNMLFYPYIVWKLIEMHIPDFQKKKSLLSFIHLQGSQTLIQNDTIWSHICKITNGFTYIPTDRYAYIG